jgi:hypothetical protein
MVAGQFGETASGHRTGTIIAAGARTPEELDTLFEDALLVRDGAALAALFDDGALFVAGDESSIRGGAAIALRALDLWSGERTYIADPQRVLQARDLALVVTERGIAVMRRGSDDTWRYAIALLMPDDATARENR